MPKFDERVAELLKKHPNLSKDDAVKIITDKNQRKKDKRAQRSSSNKPQA